MVLLGVSWLHSGKTRHQALCTQSRPLPLGQPPSQSVGADPSRVRSLTRRAQHWRRILSPSAVLMSSSLRHGLESTSRFLAHRWGHEHADSAFADLRF